MEGWFKSWRSILDWEHYKDKNTFKLFFHLIAIANIKGKREMSQWVPRGSVVIRESTVGKECGLSYQEVRTSMQKLIKSGEIKKEPTNKFCVVTIVNYEVYQGVSLLNNEQDSNEQTTNKPGVDTQNSTNNPDISNEQSTSNNLDKSLLENTVNEEITQEPTNNPTISNEQSTSNNLDKSLLENTVNEEITQEPTNNPTISNEQSTNKPGENIQNATSIVKEDKKRKKEKKQRARSLEDYRLRYRPKELIIIDDFFEVLKHTRRSAKIAESVILDIYESWEKHTVPKVLYALHKYTHSPGLHDKKENYVLGIMRNTTAEEVEDYKKQLKKGGDGHGANQSNTAGSSDSGGRFAAIKKRDGGTGETE